MLSLYRILSLGYLRLQWGRAALIVVSIALGVTMLVATRVLNETMSSAARKAARPLAGAVDLMLHNGETGVPRSLVSELREARPAGVRSVKPLVLGDVGLPLKNGQVLRPKLLGIELDNLRESSQDWKVKFELRLRPDEPERTWADVARKGLLVWLTEERRTALVGKDLAGRLGGTPNFTVIMAGKELPVWAAGTVSGEGHAAFLGGNTIVMRIEDASAILYTAADQADFVTRIDVAFEPGADPEQTQRRVEEVVGKRASVLTLEASDRSLSDVTAGLEVGFALGGAAALVVGMFLVYNALAVSVAERRHDIGILRSVGATRWQVAALFAGEAGILGLAGAALGVPLGWGLATISAGPIQEIMSDIFMPLDPRGVPLTLNTTAIAILAGLATALLAALVPALQAASEEPADAVRRVPPSARWLLRALQAGGSMLLVGLGLLAIALREWLPSRVGSYGGIVLVLVGALLITPLVAAVTARLLQPLARQLLGLEGRLAADNLARSPGRTGLVIAALGAGAALMFLTAGLTLSSEHALLGWIDERIGADLFVSSHSSITTGGKILPMDENLGQRIAQDPELKDKISHVVPVRFHEISYKEDIVFLIAFDATAARAAHQGRPPISGSELYPILAQEPDAILVSDNFAVLHGVGVGDTIEVHGKSGQLVRLRVIGTVTDYTWNRGTILMDRALYQRKFGDAKVEVFHIYVRRGQDEAEVSTLIGRKWGAGNAKEDLVVLTRKELRDEMISILHRLYSISYAQQLVVALVAALGVVTALLISVLQRRRELGLLRAVGASQGQVLLSVLAEAILMGVIGSVIGLMLGLPLEWFVLRFILVDETGFVFPIQVPWAAAGLLSLLAILIATLAGLLPAVRAMHLHIADAIAYE